MSKRESLACQWGSQKQLSIIWGYSAEHPAKSVGFEMTKSTQQVFKTVQHCSYD